MRACVLMLVMLAGSGAAATEEQCNEMLKQGLVDKNPDTRKQAVAALSLAATRGPVFGQLQGMLDDQDVEVRIATVTGLAELKTPEAREALHKALKDATPEVSFAAAKALFGLKDPLGRQALLAVVARESKTSSNFLTKQKRDALRMLHTPRVLILYVVQQGVGFVPVPGLGEGVSSMQALLNDPSVSGRAQAVLLLGKDIDAKTLGGLKDATHDADWTVRAAAVHSLALHNDPALLPELEQRLNDDKQAVRLRAAAGYLRLTEIQAQPKKRAASKTNK